MMKLPWLINGIMIPSSPKTEEKPPPGHSPFCSCLTRAGADKNFIGKLSEHSCYSLVMKSGIANTIKKKLPDVFGSDDCMAPREHGYRKMVQSMIDQLYW